MIVSTAADIKKKPGKKPGFLVVEAAGIEPASASPPPEDLHAYPVYCFSRLLPDGQGQQPAIPDKF